MPALIIHRLTLVQFSVPAGESVTPATAPSMPAAVPAATDAHSRGENSVADEF